MNTLLKTSFAAGLAFAACSAVGNAQTVEVKALGSSGIFLELGLGASSSSAGSIHATCVWSAKSGTVSASDTSVSPSAVDGGQVWVAWTPGSGTCAAPVSPTIYSYLQTDSVVGNRCLFDGTACTITNYPTTNPPAPAGLILGSGEVALPSSIATKLNSSAINAAGTDIRPEDAEFAIKRALTSCGTPVATGSQYLGLGYSNGTTIKSDFGTTPSTFNVVNFNLPANFTVTPVGATPIVVVVNNSTSDTSGLNQYSTISSAALTHFLDGNYGFANQANSSPAANGDAVSVLIREPLSGTYNTMEYNVPNSTANQSSQDVGLYDKNNNINQQNCNGSVPFNPMNIENASGGYRERAIGTGQELSEVISNGSGKTGTTGTPNANSLGYAFWSVANFAGFTGSAAPYAKYLKVDGVDPLLSSSATYSGTIPLSGSTELANVDLHTLNETATNGGYPIWSLLRLVNVGTSAPTAVSNLATAAQDFVSFGASTSRPDFITPTSLKVIRSHFIPPAPQIPSGTSTGEPTTAANGHVGLPSSHCTAAEAGGDVGGVVLTLASDNTYCESHGTNGQTGQRR